MHALAHSWNICSCLRELSNQLLVDRNKKNAAHGKFCSWKIHSGNVTAAAATTTTTTATPPPSRQREDVYTAAPWWPFWKAELVPLGHPSCNFDPRATDWRRPRVVPSTRLLESSACNHLMRLWNKPITFLGTDAEGGERWARLALCTYVPQLKKVGKHQPRVTEHRPHFQKCY